MPKPLEELQDEILDRLHAGEAIDTEAVLDEHSEHADALRAFFQVLEAVEGKPEDTGLVPARLGDFRIVREIGRGGMGIVYEAEQMSLKRRVALKVLPPTLRLDPKLVRRFRREAEAAGRLRHPGIVPVFSVGEAAGAPFFAMELVEGVSLQKVLERRRAGGDAGLPTEPDAWRAWAVETAAQVADALAYAHEQGILHRDVKPGNILLDGNGRPRLTDFGLALDLHSPDVSRTGEVLGSPLYMSPEQAMRREQPIDERTDIYSLAVTLYELLTLRLPYEGRTSSEVITALVTGQVIPPRKADPSMPLLLEHVLMGALQTDPHNRYARAAELAFDLRASIQGDAPHYAPPRAPSGRRWRAALVGLASMAAIAVAGLLLRGHPTPPDAPAPHVRVAETTDAVLAEYDASPPTTREQYQHVIGRLQSIGTDEASRALESVYRDYVDGPGSDDAAARAHLGQREFHHDVPAEIAFRGYPHVRAVEAASRKRWFGPDEEQDLRLAERAWAETLEHQRGLATGRLLAAESEIRAQIAADADFSAYNLASCWVAPYLVFYLSSEDLSEYDVLLTPADDARERRLAAITRRKAHVDELLRIWGRLFPRLHDEYLQRFGEALGLRPLMSPWGGRPDYGPEQRRFEHGVPLVVLIWADEASFRKYFEKKFDSGPLPPGMIGFFAPSTGWVVVHDSVEIPRDRPRAGPELFDLQCMFHEATHQLESWYGRQRSLWREPKSMQYVLSEGMAELLGAVKFYPPANVTFTDVNAARLDELQRTHQLLTARDITYPLFPLEALVSFESYGEVTQWPRAHPKLPAAASLTFFYQQAWAFTYFLQERHKDLLLAWYGALLDHRAGSGEAMGAAFRRVAGIQGSEDWASLQREWEEYFRDVILPMEVPR